MLDAPKQAQQAEPSHPLIIRIHEKALASQAGDEVNSTRPVRCVVLGTPASGTSWTSGKARVDTSAANESADFLVTYRGRSFSRTVGVNGPARIHSHSVTDFVLSRRVTFSPLTGFQSKRTTVQSQTRLTLDEVRSTKPGLRGALVRRIGWRRASASQREAEQVVAGQVRRQLLDAFDQQLDQRVAELNRQVEFVRYAQLLFGRSEELDIRVCSTDNCVQLAIGVSGQAGASLQFPSALASSPIEVWLHQASLRERSDLLSGPMALLSTGAKTIPALQTISLAAWQSNAPAGISIGVRNGWTVLSFDSPPTSNSRPETRLARRSAN